MEHIKLLATNLKMLATNHTHKLDFCFLAGLLSGGVEFFFGGWTLKMSILMAVMAMDFITGWLVAMVWKKSPKTADGGLKSDIGWKGLVKKFFTVVIISLLHLIDIFFGYDYLMNMGIVGFFCNEALSIIENIGLVYDLPPVITKIITVLNEKAGKKDGINQDSDSEQE